MHDPNICFGGVDWATYAYAVAVVDAAGRQVAEFDVADAADGLSDLCGRLRTAKIQRVAIERPDGPVVEALLEAELEVVVVSNRPVKALRTRYGSAGDKCDRSDAFVLADCPRTDGHRWPSLQPDSPATLTQRSHVRAGKDLVETGVAVTNQLRAHLRVTFPGGVGLFRDITRTISLRFLGRFRFTTRAAWLSEKRLGAWLRANGYCGRKTPRELFAVLKQQRAQIDDLDTLISELLDLHRDAPIFQSLPRCGTIRAATLLAEIGDCRARFLDPKSLPSLAGVAPSTRASGRHHAVTFRWAADKKLRDALCNFAGDNWRANA